MSIKLIEFEGKFNREEYGFFLTGGISSGEELPEKPAEWLTD